MKSDMIHDLSTLTTIPEVTLSSLFSKISSVICHSVYESKAAGNDIVDVDIELGRILIKFSDEEVKFKFIPSTKFEEAVKTTLTKNESPLVTDIETSLKEKILNIYKDLY